MSRITSGKVHLDISPCSPSPSSRRLGAKGITLSKLLDPAAGRISGDPNRLQPVVWDPLSNAIKFTGRNGRVQVVLERVNSHVEITVADSGIGITPDFLAHVFDRFRQEDALSTRTAKGLGLGLAIVKHLVEQHEAPCEP